MSWKGLIISQIAFPLHSSLRPFWPTRLLTYLPLDLSTYLPFDLLAFWPTRFLTYSLFDLLVFWPIYLLTFQLNYLFTYLPLPKKDTYLWPTTFIPHTSFLLLLQMICLHMLRNMNNITKGFSSFEWINV